MKILGIETATSVCGAAVIDNQQVLAAESEGMGLKHSVFLMPAVERVLHTAGICVADLDGISVSIGPGSFTGLRVGIALARGLAQAAGKPMAGVPTIDALVWQLNGKTGGKQICGMLDAKKQEVYFAFYSFRNGKLEMCGEYKAGSVENVISMVKEPTVFTGEGALKYRKELEAGLKEKFIPAGIEFCRNNPVSVAKSGLILLESGRAMHYNELLPLYVRLPEAEIQWKKKCLS